MQPYVVGEVVDSEGNTIVRNEPTVLRQVISEETSAIMREMMEYVVSDGTAGKGSVPEYGFRYVLAQNGIDPDKDLTIEWKSEQAECLSALLANPGAVAMMPQPFVTTAQTKAEGIRIALDMTEEWDQVAGKDNTLIQGVFVARTDFIQDHPQLIKDFLDDYKVNGNLNVLQQKALLRLTQRHKTIYLKREKYLL